MRESICTGCRAPIYWLRTIRGKNIPADVPGETRIMLNDDGEAIMVKTYMPHHATCPNVDDFRKKEK